MSPRTQALHRSAYLACIKYLAFIGLLDTVPDVREVKQKKSDKLPIVPLTASEVSLLLDHATTPMHRGLFGLCVGVGLRPSEALRVHWEDIDLESATLKVRGTKTEASDASIPLTDLALREMTTWRDISQFHDPCSSLAAAKFYMHKNPNHFNLFKVPSSTGDMKKVHVQETKIYKARESGSEEWTIFGRTQKEIAEILGSNSNAVSKTLNRRQKLCKGHEIEMEVIPAHDELVPIGSNKPLNVPKSKLTSPISEKYNPLVSMLRKNRKKSGNEGLGGLCFPNPRTGRELSSFKKALETAGKRANIEVDENGESRRIFPYLLRHSFATLAATSNPPVPLPVAQKVMRHTSSKLLLDVYARAGALVMREGLDNFNL